MQQESAPVDVRQTRQSDLLSLPDIQMGQVIGDMPTACSSDVAQTILRHHFGERSIEMVPVLNGLANDVFIAQTREDGIVVIKIRGQGESLFPYQKSRWATDLAIAQGIPAPKTLFVGKQEDHPYIVSRYMNGVPGNFYEGDRSSIWFEMGQIARRINAIPTFGVNPDFDTPFLHRIPHRNFDAYAQMELLPALSLEYRRVWQSLDDISFTKLLGSIDRLRALQFVPNLVHRDLVLRNVKVDERGKVVAVLDWDSASAHIGSSLEFALSFENEENEKEGLDAFREGYGLTKEEYLFLKEQIIDLRCLEYLTRLRVKIDDGDMMGAYIDEQKILQFYGS